MKKIVTLILSLVVFGTAFASPKFQITNVEYDITGLKSKMFGKTSEYALENNVSLDKKKVFETEEELLAYLDDYQVRLQNLRAFETIVVNSSYAVSEDASSEEIIPVTVNVKLQDSFHFLALPYPKYSSNDGFTLKLKMKDTNFLGTLNTLNADINLELKNDDDGDFTPSFGFNFDYDYPFKAGIFDATWVNDYGLSYTVGNDTPEWNAKTGLEFALPYEKVSYILGFYQTANRNLGYKSYDDVDYFGEEVLFKVPVTVAEIKNWSKIKYTPYVDFVYNWDKNGVNIYNTSISGPYVTLGHSLSAGRVNWQNNLRDGMSFNVANTFKYNFQREILYPEISTNVQLFKSWSLFNTKDFMNKMGVASNIYAFVDLNSFDNPYFITDGNGIGGRLRGIRDNQSYKAGAKNGWSALTVPSALVVNLDFPIHIFSTNFEKGFMKYCNFDLQLSPFVDFALTYNKDTERWFNYKDGFYAGGLEVLVYPAKWSSFTVRGSVGVDLGRFLLGSMIDTDWRQNCSKYEISFGIGLQY